MLLIRKRDISTDAYELKQECLYSTDAPEPEEISLLLPMRNRNISAHAPEQDQGPHTWDAPEPEEGTHLYDSPEMTGGGDLMCSLERRQYAWRGKRLRASCLHFKLIISTARYAVQYV